MKTYYLLVSLILTSFFSYADFGECSMLDTFNLDYPTITDESTNDLIAVDDGFIMIGSTETYTVNPGTRDYLLMKVDCNGSIVWIRAFGDIGDDNGIGLVEATNGDIVLVGRSEQAGQDDIMIVRTNSDGFEIWRKIISNPGDDNAFFVSKDGGTDMALCGFQSNGTDEDAYIAKFDALGNIIWEETYDLGLNERFNELLRKSGDLWLVGKKSGGATSNERGLVYRVSDVDGTPDWIVQRTGINTYFSLATHESGGIVAAGRYRGSVTFGVAVDRYNSGGASVWSGRFDIGGDEWAVGVRKTDNDDFIVAARTYPSATAIRRGWLLNVSQTGTLLEDRFIEKTGADDLRAMTLTDYGTVAIVGESGSAFGGAGDTWLANVFQDLESCLIPGSFHTTSDVSVTCDSEIGVTYAGGPPPTFSFLWSTGETTNKIVPANTGVYTCQIFSSTAPGCYSLAIFCATVVPNTAPTFTSCPSDITVAGSSAVTYSTPTATDDCDVPSLSLVSGLPSGAVFPVGTTNVVYQATDTEGLSVSCSFDVIVTPVCNTPLNDIELGVLSDGVWLTWDADPFHDTYELRGRKIPGGFGTATSSTNSKIIGSLESSRNYEWQVRAVCDDGSVSPYTTLNPFSTPALKLGENELFEVYPNPADDFIEIVSSGELKQIELIDNTGRVVRETCTAGRIVVADLLAGIYFVRITTTESVVVKQLVIQ